jgi:hypothetical protein
MLGALSAGIACGAGEDAFAPCPFQRGDLQGGVLVIRGDAGRADFHAPIIGLIYRTRKPLFLLSFLSEKPYVSVRYLESVT